MKSFTHRPSKTVFAIASLACALLLAGCTSYKPKVRSDFDRQADLSSYKTFGFPPSAGTDRGGYATLITTYFKDAVKREMGVRGYTFTDTNPDLLVNFYAESRDKTEVRSFPTSSMYFGYGYGYGYGYRPYGYPRYGYYSAWPFYNDIDVVNYRAGTLKLDVIDAQKNQTVWEARVEDRLTEEAQDNPQPNISRLITMMFSKYPVGATASVQ